MEQEKSERLSPPAGEGYLIVHVTTARRAIPLEGAQVRIRDYATEFKNGRGDVIATLISGRDGNTERISLPTSPLSDSLSPGKDHPYSVYNLEVHLEGYRGQIYYALPIFEGITAIQPVDMIPLPEDGTQAPFDPREDRFYETTPPIL
jgi:hypothetical protein